jgi:hypothetical protein
MEYIMVYNMATGKTEKVIPAPDPNTALAQWHSILDAYADNEDIDFIFVSEDNEADLHKYWGRLFKI